LFRHRFLPFSSANTILGWSVIINIILWIAISVQVFTTRKRLFTPLFTLVFYDAIVVTLYVALSITVLARIASWLSKHSLLLLKAQLKLTLLRQKFWQYQKVEADDKKIKKAADKVKDLDGCIEMLNLYLKLTEKQSQESIQFFGFRVPRFYMQLLFAFIAALSVATITRIALDL